MLAPAAPASASFPGANGKISFVFCNATAPTEIYTMNADGTGQTQISNGAANDQNPFWSPDGTKIAFTSGAAGAAQIWTMNADGTGRTNVSNNAFNDYDPSWSPDGTKLAFTRGAGQIYTMNATNGSGATNLSNNAANNDQDPVWSPDGAKIAFQRASGGNPQIYAMNPDGSSQTDLSNLSADSDQAPNWSPDGARIVFTRNSGSGDHPETMNADGSGQTFVPGAPFESPAWSPDGTRIALSWLSPQPQILTMNPDGSSQSQLSNSANNDQAPDWQPVVHNYARPRGATPIRVSLTPAYKQCTAPNTTHKAPFNFGSCMPPQPTSNFLTVGTPDFNGQGAQSVGSVLFSAIGVGTPSEDLAINVSMTDVRCVGTTGGCNNGPLSAYLGDLQLQTTFRLTDKSNNPGGVNGSGTEADLTLVPRVPCAPAGAGVGSTCSLSYTIDSVLPSGVVAGQRAIWQLNGDVRLYDGGSTGLSTASDHTLFAVGGVFLP